MVSQNAFNTANLTSQLSNVVSCRILVIFPCDHLADWEHLITETFLHLVSMTSTVREKIKILSSLYLNVYHFHTMVKLKTHKMGAIHIFSVFMCDFDPLRV